MSKKKVIQLKNLVGRRFKGKTRLKATKKLAFVINLKTYKPTKFEWDRMASIIIISYNPQNIYMRYQIRSYQVLVVVDKKRISEFVNFLLF